jgi:uncharacterized membrane protein
MGLGASFAIPTVLKTPTSAEQARFSLLLTKKIEVFAKVGSLTLLATGLIMGFMHTYLFKEGWFIISLIIYVLVQFIVAGIMPKKLKGMSDIIQPYSEEDVPESYRSIHATLKPYNMTLHTATILLIILMTVKPF